MLLHPHSHRLVSCLGFPSTVGPLPPWRGARERRVGLLVLTALRQPLLLRLFLPPTPGGGHRGPMRGLVLGSPRGWGNPWFNPGGFRVFGEG